MEWLLPIAGQFASQGRIAAVREYGSGNVNDTYLVSLHGEGEQPFILQRINGRVFRHPELVMSNMRVVTGHVRRRLQRKPLNAGRRFELPQVLLTQAGKDHWLDAGGSYWRAISFIDGAQSFDIITGIGHATEVGWALGMFQSLISDLPAERLADTLEGFHITPRYLRHYDEVVRTRHRGRSPEIDYALRFVEERRALAPVLEHAKEQGRLRLRPIHGDPKVNNVLIDTAARRAVSMVDLDTVKPGLIHYDLGDCLRSGCNPLGEEAEQWEAVRFEPDLCRAILQGYLSTAREFLEASDYEYLYDALRLIAFELGLRFFTDYLEGSVYFKARYEQHNLLRALVQFKLTASIERQEAAIRSMMRDPP